MSYIFLPQAVAPSDVIQQAAPTTGTTVTINATTNVLILNPAGTLLALTLSIPTGSDGQYLKISSRQVITTLTLSGATIIGTLTTLALGAFATYRFNATDNLWDRVA